MARRDSPKYSDLGATRGNPIAGRLSACRQAYAYNFLVELAPGRTLFDRSSLFVDLEVLLQGSVDVITPVTPSTYCGARAIRPPHWTQLPTV